MRSVFKSGILSISIVPLFTLVNAVEGPPKPTHGQPLDGLISRTLAAGKKRNLGPFASRVIDLSPGVPFFNETVASKESADGLDHDFRVMIDASTDTPKPLCLLLSTRQKFESTKKVEFIYFRLSLSGRPEKFARITGRIDDKGKEVKGSAVTEAMDHKSPAAQKLVQAELDFWVKGVGRKPRPISDETVSEPSPPTGLDKHH